MKDFPTSAGVRVSSDIPQTSSQCQVMASGVVVSSEPHRCPACHDWHCVWRNEFGTTICYDCACQAVGA